MAKNKSSQTEFIPRSGQKDKKPRGHLQFPVEECACGNGPLTAMNVRDKVFWTYRKLTALAELMEDHSSGGRRGPYGGFANSKRYAGIEYPDMVNGLGEVLMGVAAELAWLHHMMETHGLKDGP